MQSLKTVCQCENLGGIFMLLPCQNAQFIKKNYLDKYIYGQNQATQALATAVAQHFLACEYNELCDSDSKIKNVSILVMGPSGSGKSEFARTLKRLCDNYGCGYYIGSASQYSPNSTWKGQKSIDRIISDAFCEYGNKFFANHSDITDIQLASELIKRATENAIIVIDEADKIFRKDSDDCERSSSHDYQSSLLKLVEGIEVQTDSFTHERNVPEANQDTGSIEFDTIVETLDSVTIDTKNIMWIMLGAFEGLDKITERRIQRENNKDTVHDYYQCCRAGFIQDVPATTKTANNPTPVKIPPPNVDDLVEYGLKRELAGRLAVRVRFNPLNVSTLIRIMQTCPTSAYRDFQQRFKLLNCELHADYKALQFIAKNCLANGHNGTGARALESILYEILSPVMYDLSAETEPCVCRLTGKRLKCGLPPIIEKLKPQRNTQSEEEIMTIINNSKIRKTESA